MPPEIVAVLQAPNTSLTNGWPMALTFTGEPPFWKSNWPLVAFGLLVISEI